MSTLKKQLFEQLALIAHSLGSPQRIELLDYLAQAERSVEELSLLTDLSIANTSRHLQILKQNGLVVMRKQGKSRIYSLAGDDIIQLVASIRKTAETHLAEVDKLKNRYLKDSSTTEIISSQQLAKQLHKKALCIVDVRPEKEFRQGHIQGAINIEPDKINAQLSQIPKNKTIVSYCRGPYCVYSNEMIASLKSKGIPALKLEEGFPEWKAAGLPFEVTK